MKNGMLESQQIIIRPPPPKKKKKKKREVYIAFQSNISVFDFLFSFFFNQPFT